MVKLFSWKQEVDWYSVTAIFENQSNMHWVVQCGQKFADWYDDSNLEFKLQIEFQYGGRFFHNQK